MKTSIIITLETGFALYFVFAEYRILITDYGIHGAVAQLGERNVRNVEVEGSIPFRSTILCSTQTNENCRGIVPETGTKPGFCCINYARHPFLLFSGLKSRTTFYTHLNPRLLASRRDNLLPFASL